MKPIEKIIDGCGLEPTGQTPGLDGMPVLTHRGKLRIGDLTFDCGRLSSGEAIFFGDEFEKFIRDYLFSESWHPDGFIHD